jgi:acetyl esterase/lipase
MIVEADLVYATTTRRLMWDVYRPDGDKGPLPAVLVFHGGGYVQGSRKDMAAACAAFVDKGFVAIAPEYRFFGEAAWPAALEDAQLALNAAVGGAANLGISAGQLFLAGYSAGAHLSLLAAASTGFVAGIAAFFPRVRIESAEAARFGLTEDVQQTGASPIEYASTLPPTILFTGDDDDVVPFDNSVELYRTMRASGRTADLQIFSQLPHEFVTLPGMTDLTVRNAAAFFVRTVLDRDSFSAAEFNLRKWWDTVLNNIVK